MWCVKKLIVILVSVLVSLCCSYVYSWFKNEIHVVVFFVFIFLGQKKLCLLLHVWKKWVGRSGFREGQSGYSKHNFFSALYMYIYQYSFSIWTGITNQFLLKQRISSRRRFFGEHSCQIFFIVRGCRRMFCKKKPKWLWIFLLPNKMCLCLAHLTYTGLAYLLKVENHKQKNVNINMMISISVQPEDTATAWIIGGIINLVVVAAVIIIFIIVR